MPHPVVHFEIGCLDSSATQNFYRSMFDWQIAPMGPAAMIDTAVAGGITGHMTSLGHEPHHYTIFYVAVDDLDAYLKKAAGLGGKTLVPPVYLPGQGGFAWMADPDGNTVGLWKAATKYQKSRR